MRAARSTSSTRGSGSKCREPAPPDRGSPTETADPDVLHVQTLVGHVPKAVGPGRVVHFRPAAACASPPPSTTARTRRPPSSRARWASRAVAPVVSTSSQTHDGHGDSGPTSQTLRGRRSAPPSSRTGWRPAGRRRARPGRAPAAHLEQARDAHTPAPRCRSRRAAARAIRSIGSCPRARTTAGREGTGTSTVGLRRQDRPARPRPAPGRAGRPARTRRAPCGRAPSRAAGRRTPPRRSRRRGRAGHGVGRTDRPRVGRRRRAVAAQRAPGRAAAHAAAAVDEVEPGVEHAVTLTAGDARGAGAVRPPVDRRTVAGGLGTQAVSGRTSPRATLESVRGQLPLLLSV